MRTTTFSFIDHLPASVREFPKRRAAEIAGLARSPASAACRSRCSPGRSATRASITRPARPIHNLLGAPGAIAADLVMQSWASPRSRCGSAGLLGLAPADPAPARAAAPQGRPLSGRRDRRGGARLAPSRAGKLAAADRPRRRRRRRRAHGARAASSRSRHGRRSPRRWPRGRSRSSGSPRPRASATRRAA